MKDHRVKIVMWVGGVLITASSAIAATPVTPNASPQARALLNFIHATYGQKTLSGQMWAPWGIDEIKTVHEITGKYPALRGQDYIHERSNERENEMAIEWWKTGGIPIPYHECGTLPDPDECFKQGITWSWWMLWHTSHLTRHNREELIRIYNHDLVLTRDELPNIMGYLDNGGGSAGARSDVTEVQTPIKPNRVGTRNQLASTHADALPGVIEKRG